VCQDVDLEEPQDILTFVYLAIKVIRHEINFLDLCSQKTPIERLAMKTTVKLPEDQKT
jgi:hypothetical protein